MNKRASAKKRWKSCPTCYQLVFTAAIDMGNHICPETILAKHEAELDMVIYEELSTWDADVEKFWNSKDVKFWNYLLRTKKTI